MYTHTLHTHLGKEKKMFEGGKNHIYKKNNKQDIITVHTVILMPVSILNECRMALFY